MKTQTAASVRTKRSLINRLYNKAMRTQVVTNSELTNKIPVFQDVMYLFQFISFTGASTFMPCGERIVNPSRSLRALRIFQKWFCFAIFLLLLGMSLFEIWQFASVFWKMDNIGEIIPNIIWLTSFPLAVLSQVFYTVKRSILLEFFQLWENTFVQYADSEDKVIERQIRPQMFYIYLLTVFISVAMVIFVILDFPILSFLPPTYAESSHLFNDYKYFICSLFAVSLFYAWNLSAASDLVPSLIYFHLAIALENTGKFFKKPKMRATPTDSGNQRRKLIKEASIFQEDESSFSYSPTPVAILSIENDDDILQDVPQDVTQDAIGLAVENGSECLKAKKTLAISSESGTSSRPTLIKKLSIFQEEESSGNYSPAHVAITCLSIEHDDDVPQDWQKGWLYFEAIRKLVNQTNSLFGPILLLNHGAMFFVASSNIFSILRFFRGMSWVLLLMNGMNAAATVLRFSTTILMCSRLSTASDQLQSRISSYMATNWSNFKPSERQFFTAFLVRTSEGVVASPLDLYPIRPFMLLGLLSLLCTYLIVMLQSSEIKAFAHYENITGLISKTNFYRY